jgi:hypothetical protein
MASLAALLVLAGQFAAFVYNSEWSWGLALTALGLGLFLWARFGAPAAWAARLIGGVPLTPRRLLVLVAVLFSVTATWFAAALENEGRSDYAPALALWAAAGLALLAAFAPPGLWRAELASWLRRNLRELLVVGGVTLLGAALRMYKLGEIPRVVESDGALVGLTALSTASGPLANPFASWESMGGMYLQSINLAMLAFGRTPFALRLLPAIAGSLAVPALYLLGRRLFGPRVALISAVLLASSHAHLHFSRTVAVIYTQGTFLGPLMMYLLLSGLENRSSLRMALAGAVLSLYFGIYVDSGIYALFALAFMLIAWFVARPVMRGRLPQVVAFLLVAGILVLPRIYYASTHPDDYLGGFNMYGSFQSGWLANMMAETGQSAVTILGGRVVHAFLSLFYYPAQSFYGSTKSLLHFMTASLFLMGLAYSLWRARDHRHLLAVGLVLAPAVAIGLTAVPPSADSYRMLIAVPGALLLAGVGAEELLTLLANSSARRAAMRTALGTATLITVSTLSLKTYFLDFAERCRYGGDLPTRYASYLGKYLGRTEPSGVVYLLSDDNFWYGPHASVDFLSGGRAVQNFPGPTEELPFTADTLIVAAPTRIGELQEWARDYPGGAFDTEYDCGKPILMGYRIP